MNRKREFSVQILVFVILAMVWCVSCVKRVSLPDGPRTARADHSVFQAPAKKPVVVKTNKEAVISKAEFEKMYTPPQVVAAKLQHAGGMPVLYPGDEITIGIYDKLPVSQEVRIEKKRIGEDGMIFILPIKEVAVAGLTLTEAEKAVEGKLSDFVVSPYCEIALDKRAFEPRIYIFGEVGQSGVFVIRDGFRLLDAISVAGGCGSDAYRRSIKIIRVKDQTVAMLSIDLGGIMLDGNMDDNVALQDQDIVVVPRRFYSSLAEVMSLVSNFMPWYYFIKNF